MKIEYKDLIKWLYKVSWLNRSHTKLNSEIKNFITSMTKARKILGFNDATVKYSAKKFIKNLLKMEDELIFPLEGMTHDNVNFSFAGRVKINHNEKINK